jgi:hypothetical protein
VEAVILSKEIKSQSFNKIKIEESENFYEKYFNDFNIKTAKHYLKKKSVEILDTKVVYKGSKWSVGKIEYGTCDECNHPVFALDTYRGERVCERCE